MIDSSFTLREANAICAALGGDLRDTPSLSRNASSLIQAIRGDARAIKPGLSNDALVMCQAALGLPTKQLMSVSRNARAIAYTFQQAAPSGAPTSNTTNRIINAIGASQNGSDPGPPPDYLTVANANARLALTGISVGQKVFQTNNSTMYQYVAASTAQGGVAVLGGTQDGIYTLRGEQTSKAYYNVGNPNDPVAMAISWAVENLNHEDILAWWIFGPTSEELIAYSLSDTVTPDLAGTDKLIIGVGNVAYTVRGEQNGKPYYNKAGSGDSVSLDAIVWSGTIWRVRNAAGANIATSGDDTATPDLASFNNAVTVTNVAWLNASDDTPASITVTSVTEGDLVAGNKLGSVVRQVNGATNGRNKYSDLLAVAPDLTWDGTKWTDGTTDGSTNTAFPDIGTADPVAAESNWEVV